MIDTTERPNTEKLNINFSYPDNPNYEYKTSLCRLNLDEERIKSISTGRGFNISEPQSTLKKDLKNINSIYSTRFGQTLQDVNPFEDRYKCDCGHYKGRLYNGILCPTCKSRVKYIDDDFGYFGWITIKDPYYIIHPNLYKSIEFLIGPKRLDNILLPINEKDENGFTKRTINPKTEPYAGIGILKFKENFDEIMDFYLKKSPNKKDYYEDIYANKEKIFVQSIPVYTTHLRPYKVDSIYFKFEGTNALYNMITKLASKINQDNLKIYRKNKTKDKLLYDCQTKYNKLYQEIVDILSGKKGTIKSLLGGRYNFTSRDVIVPSPRLRINQVTMPYIAMVELLQQRIINILVKTRNFSYADAYRIWEASKIKKDETVYQIIKGIIVADKGVAVIINRNPTICYGGILFMRVVDITDTYTLGLPLQILPLLAADFDGDALNVHMIINKNFEIAAEQVLSPRNAMYISRNDGYFNNDLNHAKDLIVNANTLIEIGRENYTNEQLAKINRAKNYHMAKSA